MFPELPNVSIITHYKATNTMNTYTIYWSLQMFDKCYVEIINLKYLPFEKNYIRIFLEFLKFTFQNFKKIGTKSLLEWEVWVCFGFPWWSLALLNQIYPTNLVKRNSRVAILEDSYVVLCNGVIHILYTCTKENMPITHSSTASIYCLGNI